MKRLFQIVCCLLLAEISYGNNVRVVGTVNVDGGSVREGVVSIKLTLEWENSWRDSYNHDAVYVMLKYRKQREQPSVWHHVYLQNTGHTADNGFTWTLAPGAEEGKNVGIFIHRSSAGRGISRTNLSLKWNFGATTDPRVTASEITLGEVIASCTGIEMVYIPRGVFSLGDMAYTGGRAASLRTFRHRDMYIPESYDVVSDRYLITTSYPEVEGHEPSLAANHVNDISNSTTNAWVGNNDESMLWTIDFCMLADSTELPRDSMRTVNYIGIESIPGHTPKSWILKGATEDKNGAWNEVHKGSGSDWGTSLERVYPVVKAIKLDHPGKYRYYRLIIDRSDMPSGVVPVIKTLSMSERDLSTDYDYTFVVDGSTLPLGGSRGLSASDDVEEWGSGTLPSTYPTGYKAFYVMKYEMSQEQYAGFLQLLPPESQRRRTIGDGLSSLDKGSYVFGAHDRVNCRNGIVISTWNESRDTASFGCDLNPSDAAVSLDGDGMPVGCNYLSAEDMLAYASWSGLRPLTELEYERMCRPPFPSLPLSGSCAWGTRDAEIPSGFTDDGKSSERFSSGNANFRNVLDGPCRVGIFATDKTGRVGSGASFWGVMDLSGNLSELYYNANSSGRKFTVSSSGRSEYGNGVLPVNGICNIAGWVTDPKAFALRGGHFGSTSSGDLASSLRLHAWGAVSDITRRDSTVSFRLGRNCADGEPLESVLTLSNGQTTAFGSVSDTLCDGGDYTIVGNEPEGSYVAYYLWYKSENQGVSWELLRDTSATGRDLTVKGLRNTGLADHVLQEYWYRRLAIRDNSDGMSEIVKLKVVNPSYTVSRYRDTLDGYGTGAGIRVTAKYNTSYSWSYLGSGGELAADESTAVSSRYIPKKSDLALPDEGPLHGTKYLMVKLKILGRCERSDVIRVDVSNVLDKEKMYVKDYGGYRGWGDGCYAPSAEAYRHPTGGYEYRGDVGSGVYRIDPDGRSGPVEPFDVYCDMEAEDGPWMLAMKGAPGSTTFTYASAYWTDKRMLNTDKLAPDIAVDAKSGAYIYCPFTQFRIKMQLMANGKAMEFRENFGAANCINLFSATKELSTTGRPTILQMINGYDLDNLYGLQWERNYPRWGVNFRGVGYSGWINVRYGIIADETSNASRTEDSVIGIGMVVYGAGARSTCGMGTIGKTMDLPGAFWIWIK